MDFMNFKEAPKSPRIDRLKEALFAKMPEIEADLRRIHRELGPCDVVMADIETDTPDERVAAVARLAAETAEGG